MAESTLYLFDGYNLLHAAGYDDPRELRDTLASFVAVKGARGVLVFDGVGTDEVHGPLEVRFAEHADTLLERLAAEHRDAQRVVLVSSDTAVRGTSGLEVQKLSSQTFLRDLEEVAHRDERPQQLRERLDPATRDALERLRRGEGQEPRASIVRKRIDSPDRAQVFLDGSERAVVEVGGAIVGRGVFRPGWRWSEHVQPLAAPASAAHLGYVVSGRMGVRASDGTEVEVAAGDVFFVGPGHDAWVVGDEPCVALDFARAPR
jgi:predicted RNA-binding protein with PIN domain/quercetin dioxygenase-like cupin family protein